MNNFDMTTPARRCAMLNLLSESLMLQCYADMGMTEACGRMWGYNSANTRNLCLPSCMKEFFLEKVGLGGNNGPAPECAMNTCLQCDEDNSGPNFAKYAGRTRRNTGLESCITRPCEANKSLVHEICPKANTELLWKDLMVAEDIDQQMLQVETELGRDVIVTGASVAQDEFQGMTDI